MAVGRSTTAPTAAGGGAAAHEPYVTRAVGEDEAEMCMTREGEEQGLRLRSPELQTLSQRRTVFVHEFPMFAKHRHKEIQENDSNGLFDVKLVA